MSMAAIAWIADVLRDSTSGLNAQLASAPKLSTWPTAPAVPVFDECRDSWVATDTLPQTVLEENDACVIVRRIEVQKGDVLPAGNGYDAGAVALHYLARQRPGDTTRSDLALIAWQTLRTARRVLTQAMPDFVQPTYPVRAGCEFGVADQNVFDHTPMQAPIQSGLLFDALVVRFAVHDWWALGLDAPQTP